MTRIHFSPDDGFRRAVTARVDAYFTRTCQSRLAGPATYAKAALFAAIMLGAYAALLGNVAGAWGSLALAIVYGLAALLLALNVAHDAAHVALTGNRRWDLGIQRAAFALMGVDGYLWHMRHDGSHHVFPNVNGCDVDIDENPFVRLSPNHPRRPHQRFQHLYAPVLYMLTLFDSIAINDAIYLFKKRLANMRAIRHAPGDIALFVLVKIFYLTVTIVLPLALIRLPWWQILLGYVAMLSVMSLVFVFLLIGVHFSDTTQFPQVGPGGRLPTSWAVHALETSLDWAPQSLVANLLTGGSNAHAAHHLFPRISHRHYPAITAIIRDTAAEFGVRYNATSFRGMIAGHFRHLYRLGRPPAGLSALTPLRS